MKRLKTNKILLTFGLILIYMLFTSHVVPNNTNVVYASNIETSKPKSRLNLKSKSIVRGKTFSLQVYNASNKAKISYSSSNNKVATVDSDGLVTAVKVGTAIINITIRDNETSNLSCNITVGPPAVSIMSNSSLFVVGNGDSDLLKVSLKPNNTAEDAKFSSYDSDVASISSGGRITGQGIGHTYIFAEIGDINDNTDKFIKCNVIVIPPGRVKAFQNFFNDTPELNNIPDADFSKALDDFFNSKGSKTVKRLDHHLKSIFNFAQLRKAEKTITKNLYLVEAR